MASKAVLELRPTNFAGLMDAQRGEPCDVLS